MDDGLKIKLYAVTLDCIDPYELAKFYAALLHWEIPFHDEDYVVVSAPGANQGGVSGRNFSAEPRVYTACMAGRA